MNSAINKISLNRYPGVKPFSIPENFMFFGRESDIENLNSLIFVNQTVVLYGKSGYGKSSLINAGIIPRLQQSEEWAYFSIRFNNFSEKELDKNLSPLQTIQQRLSESLSVQKNNLLDNLIPREDSLWYWIKQNQLQKSKKKFIIFFDQFEELFTYRKEQINEFSEQLSQLLYTTLPVSFKKKLIDVEDDISNEQHDFLYEKPEVKVIFSIRSDRLSLLNLLKDKQPSILQNSYELNALSIEDARRAIIEPAKLPRQLGFATPEFDYTDAAVNKITASIANPQDGKIEAATLQIVCRFVEDTLVKEKSHSTIGDEELGDITGIFQQYYQSVLDKLTASEKKQAQRLIEDELIESDRRNPLSESYIKSRFGINERLLTLLEQSSLLKKERDARGTILYEVSHDSLIDAINKIAESRRKEENEKRQVELQQQIEEERRRSNELKLLNEKANRHVKVALLAFFIAIVFAVAAGFFAIDSNKQKENALQSEESAKRALNDKEKEEAKGKAKDFIQRADEFMNAKGENYTQYALERYTKAREIMEPYREDAIYETLEDKIKRCQE